MIHRVVLQNFISHKDTDIQLGRGVTVFVGPNGSGKSTVIDGITFALYGEHVRGPNEALVRDGTSGAAVSVEFDARSRTFFVERKLDMKGRLEGAVLKETTDGVTKQIAAGERKHFDESTTSEEVAKVLGLDYERMKVAAIVQQGELDSIIRDFSPKEFKELVNSLIGIDGLEAAYQNMLVVINDFRSNLRGVHGYDDTNVGALELAMADKQQSLQKNREGAERTKKALAVFRKRQTDLNQWKAEAEPLRQKAGRFRDSVEGLIKYAARRRDELDSEREDLDRITTQGPGYLRLAGKEGTVSKRVKGARLDLAGIEELIGELTSKLGELRPQKTKPKELVATISRAKDSLALLAAAGNPGSRLKAIDLEIRKKTARLGVLERTIGTWEANKETAKKLEFKDGICPYCGSKVDHVRPIFDPKEIVSHLEAHNKEIEELESTKSDLEAERLSVEREANSARDARLFLSDNGIVGKDDVASLERTKAELEAELTKVPKYTADLKKGKHDKGKLSEELSDLGVELSDISAAKTFLAEHRISSKEDIRRLGKRRAELRRILSRLPEELDELGDKSVSDLKVLAIDVHSKELYSGVVELSREAARFNAREYEEKMELLDRLTSRIIPDEVAKEKIFETAFEQDEADLKRLNAAVRELKRAAEFTAVLTKIRERVYHRDGPVPSSLRSWALNHIGLKASEFARSFNIGVSSIQLREKANHVSIDCYGQRGSVETAALSGGEKVAIALALRFGMAYVMGGYKLDFVFLDEPTIHLDPERRATMVDIVTGLGAEDSPIKQTVIITHDTEIFEDADVDVVYRFEKTPEGTKVVAVP
ncbi:MAG: SMC family ATPase [Nitrososphaerota archaeon]|nr:SMC family ATPase [Nitrososphaerota archaeon]MDG7023707.1 SMC family ATPase [Nitrososphaerota archaeon]